MSEQIIFSIDYSRCDSVAYEIQSRINYLERILELKDEMANYINLSGIDISSSDKNANLTSFENNIFDEIIRYKGFKDKFIAFCEDIRSLDEKLEVELNSNINLINANESYDVYVSALYINQESNTRKGFTDILKKHGLSEKDIEIITMLVNEDTQNLIKEYANLDELDFDKKLEALQAKVEKTPLELFAIDILCLNDRRTALNFFNDCISKDGTTVGIKIAEILNSCYWGEIIGITPKNKVKYEKMVKDLNRYENKKNKINNSKEMNKIKEKTAKFREKVNSTNTGKKVNTVTGLIGGLTTTWNLYAAITPNWNDWRNGGELNESIMGTGVDAAGIFGSSMIGSAAGLKIGGAVGSLLGPIGTGVGVVSGFLIGSLVWYTYDEVIDPIANKYIELNKKAIDERHKEENELEDKLDMLGW